MFRVVFELFLAGSETTSMTLDWAFLFMTEFPEVQKKCQDEIEKVSVLIFNDKSLVLYRTVWHCTFTNLLF